MHCARETVMLKAVVRAVTTVLQRVKGHKVRIFWDIHRKSSFISPKEHWAVCCWLFVVECAGFPPAGKQSFHVADVCPL